MFSEEELHKVLSVRSQRGWGGQKAQNGKRGSERAWILSTTEVFNEVYICSPMTVYESIFMVIRAELTFASRSDLQGAKADCAWGAGNEELLTSVSIFFGTNLIIISKYIMYTHEAKLLKWNYCYQTLCICGRQVYLHP